MAQQRGFQIVAEYTDKISGTKARRPGLGDLLRDARRGRFQVILVWASDRIARSVRHFPRSARRAQPSRHRVRELPGEPGYRRPAGAGCRHHHRAIAELERNLIIERVRAGMRRARLEGRHIGRRPLDIDRAAVLRERAHGQSLTQIAKSFQISRATVSRLIKQEQQQAQ